MNLLQRVGLIGYDEPLPADDDYPDEFYHVAGIVPMLWQWARDTYDFAADDLRITLEILAEDHEWISRLTGRKAERWQLERSHGK